MLIGAKVFSSFSASPSLSVPRAMTISNDQSLFAFPCAPRADQALSTSPGTLLPLLGVKVWHFVALWGLCFDIHLAPKPQQHRLLVTTKCRCLVLGTWALWACSSQGTSWDTFWASILCCNSRHAAGYQPVLQQPRLTGRTCEAAD